MPRSAKTCQDWNFKITTKNLDPPFTIHPIFEYPNGFVIITTSEAGPLGSARRAMKRDIWTPSSSNTLNEALLRHWLCKLQSSYRHLTRQSSDPFRSSQRLSTEQFYPHLHPRQLQARRYPPRQIPTYCRKREGTTVRELALNGRIRPCRTFERRTFL